MKALEEKNVVSVSSIVAKINAMALKSAADFDKLEALGIAQELVRVSALENHEKATLYAASLEEMRSRLAKPPAQFKAYFLALFADKEFAKITQSLAKVDKALTTYTTRRASPNGPGICFRCGRPGHYANRCRLGGRPYNYRPQGNRGPHPYQRFQNPGKGH